MVLKVVNASELRVGGYMLVDGETCLIRSLDVSKTGKHGAHKCRFEAIAVMTGKKKCIVCPGTDRYDVPMIEKRKGQVLTVTDGVANLMDSDSFENLELPIPEELKDVVTDGVIVEYWDMEGVKIIKRIF
ncbi:translation initiation factor IF-5A [archaeon]|nr:translation initiation factor IF-5A [archaeon]